MFARYPHHTFSPCTSQQPSFSDFYSSPYATQLAYHDELERLVHAAAHQQQLEEERHRRQADAAAFVEAQRRRQREAALEQALRAEVERRQQLERALAVRTALLERAQQEQEARRRAAFAVAAQRRRAVAAAQEEHRRRLVAAAAEEDRRRRINEARRQRQAVESAVPAFLQLLFDIGAEDVVQPQREQPEVQQAQPAKVEAPTAQEPAAPSSAPAKPVPESTASVDLSPLEDAATVLQRHFRRHAARRAALSTLSSLTTSFEVRQSAFSAPSSLTFQSAAPAGAESGSATPPLAFGKPNAPFLGYEDFLVGLLSKIDAVESGGDRVVKQARKALVKRVEAELARLDGLKEEAWERQSQKGEAVVDAKPHDVAEYTHASPADASAPSAASLDTTAPGPELQSADATAPVPEPSASTDSDSLSPIQPEPASEPTAPALPSEASEPSTIPVDTPAPEEAASSSPSPADDATPAPPDEPTPTPLTAAAVASLPRDSSVDGPSVPRPASRASTRSVSSDESGQLEQYVAEVLRQAARLGEEVRRLEGEESGQDVQEEVKREQEGEVEVEKVRKEEHVEAVEGKSPAPMLSTDVEVAVKRSEVEEEDAASEAGTEDFEVV
ncbi:hypothetical protein JCM10207_001066 [Rhodosporidiobolus poonsookiae]